MVTKLEGDLRREIEIDGVCHVVTLTKRGFMLTVKGRRKGLEIAWSDLVSGEAALATALNASLTANIGRAGMKATPQAPARGRSSSAVKSAKHAKAKPTKRAHK
jgi:hypothetical protein